MITIVRTSVGDSATWEVVGWWSSLALKEEDERRRISAMGPTLVGPALSPFSRACSLSLSLLSPFLPLSLLSTPAPSPEVAHAPGINLPFQ